MPKLPRILFLLFLGLWGSGAANVNVVGDLTRSFEVQPGEAVRDSIEVRNTGDAEAEVRIYLTDYTFDAVGTVSYPDPGTLPRSNAPWIGLGRTSFVVPAGQTVSVPYSITVPSTDLTGSYWSMVMVEVVTPEEDPAAGVGFRAVVRYGLQVVSTIDPSAPSELVFVNPELSREESGEPVLTVDVSNSGTRMLRSRLYLDLFDDQGSPLGRIEGNLRRTYPGTAVRQSFTLGDLTPGNYMAIVVADAGSGDVFGAQYNLSIEAE